MKYTAEMKIKEARNDEKTFLKKSAEMTCADTVTNSEIYKKKKKTFHRKVSRESVLWLDSLNCHVKRWFIIFAIQQNLHTFRLPYKPVDFVDLSLVQTQRIE